VEQRTWDIVLGLIILSFNCSKTQVKAKKPMVKGNTGKFKSQIKLF
jgi:hypothetical protein